VQEIIRASSQNVLRLNNDGGILIGDLHTANAIAHAIAGAGIDGVDAGATQASILA
jgi:hypothetical protein